LEDNWYHSFVVKRFLKRDFQQSQSCERPSAFWRGVSAPLGISQPSELLRIAMRSSVYLSCALSLAAAADAFAPLGYT
jgi:hypothetical protein